MSQSKKRIVIVGAGFGGLITAKSLRGVDALITIIDRYNHHLFQPLLYQVATAALSPAEISSPIRSVLRHQSNAEVLMDEVCGIEWKTKQVLLKDRKLSYDILVLATGASHTYFGHDEWEPFAPGLKTLSDAIAIRQKVLLAFEEAEKSKDPSEQQRLLRFILVGGGPTGVEMAGAIAELAHSALTTDFRHINPKQAQVILIEAGNRILSGFSESLSKKATLELNRLGVEVLTEHRVEMIDAKGVIANGKRIPSFQVIWTAGVKASPAGQWLETPTDRAGRVLVNSQLQVLDRPDIYVIGDTAHFEQDGKPLPGVAPVAMQQAYFIAKLIKTRLKFPHQDLSLFFKYVNRGNLATIGRRFAIAQVGSIETSGFTAWLAWSFTHIYYLIGFRNRLIVFLQWAWAYFTYQRGARLIVTRIIILVGLLLLTSCSASPTKDTHTLQITGTLRRIQMAIGAETTGSVLVTDAGEYYELDWKQNALPEQFKNKRILVSGTPQSVQGVERLGRKIIAVSHWEPAP